MPPTGVSSHDPAIVMGASKGGLIAAASQPRLSSPTGRTRLLHTPPRRLHVRGQVRLAGRQLVDKPLVEVVSNIYSKSCPRGPTFTAEPTWGAIPGEVPGDRTDDRKAAGDGPGGGSTITSNRGCRCASWRRAGSSGRFVVRLRPRGPSAPSPRRGMGLIPRTGSCASPSPHESQASADERPGSLCALWGNPWGRTPADPVGSSSSPCPRHTRRRQARPAPSPAGR